MPDHPMRKVQTQLLVELAVRQRADALALVLNTPRAEVLRKALEGAGLRDLEITYKYQLEELDLIGQELGMTRYELAEQATKEGVSLAELKTGQSILHVQKSE